jgi:hypothetical protein
MGNVTYINFIHKKIFRLRVWLSYSSGNLRK